MTTSRLFMCVIAAAAVAAPALYAGCMLAWLVIADPLGGAPHPTDEAMLAEFASEREVLEELVRMIGEDPKLLRMAPDFTRPEDIGSAGMSADRVAAYRRLCAKAGIAHGFSHYGEAIEFILAYARPFDRREREGIGLRRAPGPRRDHRRRGP